MHTSSTKELALVILKLMERKTPKAVARAVANYLVQERRTGDLGAIMREVRRLRAKEHNIVEVDTTSAFPLHDKIRSLVKGKFPGKRVVLTESLDKNVIGGVLVETDDTQIDATIKRQLNRLELLIKPT